MTYSRPKQKELSEEEIKELFALKNAINYNPSQVHPEKLELFTALLVKTLEGKGDIRPSTDK